MPFQNQNARNSWRQPVFGTPGCPAREGCLLFPVVAGLSQMAPGDSLAPKLAKVRRCVTPFLKEFVKPKRFPLGSLPTGSAVRNRLFQLVVRVVGASSLFFDSSRSSSLREVAIVLFKRAIAPDTFLREVLLACPARGSASSWQTLIYLAANSSPLWPLHSPHRAGWLGTWLRPPHPRSDSS